MLEKSILFSILLLFLSSCSIKQGITSKETASSELNELSIQFLEAIRDNKSTQTFRKTLEQTTLEVAISQLDTDNKRYAFWLNIYNAYILDILNANPALYEDRGSFFREKRIKLFGHDFSFGEIEHGIIRRSQNEFGLGYLTKWFPSKIERKLRVKKRDYRVHFALNCGAKDCPPVGIYSPTALITQLKKSTNLYLNSSSIYDENSNVVKITSLFSWFRGDFGGKKGTKRILEEYKITPADSSPKLEYKPYDWTLYLNNFISL